MFRKWYERWMVLCKVIGNFMSRLFLTVFYIVIVGIVSLLVGRWQNYLKKKCPPESNWDVVPHQETDLSHAQKQF